MSSETIVHYCAPTLAGIKTGNMFSERFEDKEEMNSVIRYWNSLLNKKGLRVLPLRYRNGDALIYIYRISSLEKDLHNTLACSLLTERGYKNICPEKCIVRLIERLKECEEFPHEIGLFLGYPPYDVLGFIENKAEKCKLVGFWKVYGDEEKAKNLFSSYKKFTNIYNVQLAMGIPVEKLAVFG